MKSGNGSAIDMIVDGIKDITDRLIEDHIKEFGRFPTQEEVRKRFIALSPGVASDNIFADMFPLIYGIKYAEYMIKKTEGSGANKGNEENKA